MTVYMATIPRERVSKKKIFLYLEIHDIHKWVIGRETGRNGYKHWQMRFKTSQDEAEVFEDFKEWFKTGHLIKASDSWSYETKSGDYLRDDDNAEKYRQRFGKFTDAQKRVIKTLDATNDREIVVWCTEGGNAGKTWLRKALWERRLAHFTSPVKVSADKMVQDIASAYIKQGNRKYVILDLPRSYKWTQDMYIAVEMIKDGLISDPRYESESINISGTKVLVLCNDHPKVDRLSADRWVILTGADALP